jgi:chromate transporter
VEKGLAPVAVGLIFAGCTAVARSLDPGILALATIAAALAILYVTKIGPYYIMTAAALIHLGVFYYAG